jgi:hypothetical protein
MFETLRRLIFPIIIVVLLFFVAMIILEWGANYTGRNRYQTVSYAAKINGEKVPYDVYQRVYNNLYQAESQQNDGEVSEERSRQLEEEAWNQILQDRLLRPSTISSLRTRTFSSTCAPTRRNISGRSRIS